MAGAWGGTDATLIDGANILKSFSAIGLILDGATRSLRIRRASYVLVYRIRDPAMQILRVRHDRQDWCPE